MNRFASSTTAHEVLPYAENEQLSSRRSISVIFPETFDEHDTSEDSDADPVPEVKKKTSRRVYYLDWLRVIAIYLVVSYHVVVVLRRSPYSIFPTDNKEAHQVVAFQCLALQFGMPIFFHISGRAQAFSRPTSLCAFIKSRTLRLALPFFPAWLLTMPLAEYVSWYGRDKGAPTNFFHYLVWYFTPGNFRLNLGWLWFLPTLYLVSFVAGPLITFAEGAAKNRLWFGYPLASIIIWVASTFFLRFNGMYLFSWRYCLGTMTGYFVAVVLVVLVPFPPHPSDQKVRSGVPPSSPLARWIAVRVLTLTFILSQVGMVSGFRYADMPKAMVSVTPVYLFLGYFIQGYFVQRWGEALECKEARIHLESDEQPHVGYPVSSSRESNDLDDVSSEDPDEEWQPRKSQWIRRMVSCVRIGNILLIGVQQLVILISSPIGVWEHEIFPIYSASFQNTPSFAICHVLGTWAWISVFVALGIAYADFQVDPFWYKHLTSSTIIVYIFHELWARMFKFFVIEHMLRAGASTGGWMTVIYCTFTGVFAVACSWAIYILFEYVPCLGCIFGMG